MSDLEICRICLRKGVTLYKYDRYHLKQYYEEIMAKKVKTNDSLPHYFCYICAAILYKFHKFKEKCHTGEKSLQNVFSGPITQRSISLIDKYSKNLQSHLQFITISKRIRTCIVKHKTKRKVVNELNEVLIREMKENDSDSTTNEKYLSEIKTETIHKDIESMETEDKNKIETETLDEKVSEEIKESHFENDNIFYEDDFIESDNDIKEFTEDNEIVKHDIEKAIEENKINNEVKTNRNNKRKKGIKSNKDASKKKPKKFEKRDTREDRLDVKHWVKVRLTEEEANEEFKARAHNKKYLAAEYHCTLCYKGFSREDMLNRHKILRHGEHIGPVECRFCGMRFKQKNKLSRHIEEHYTKFKCLRCNLVCPLLTTALLHNESHNGLKKQCEHCGKEFTHQSTYYTHLRTHRSEHVCTLCGASFVSKLGLGFHKKNMHVNTIVTPEGEVDTYCARCDIKFVTLLAYQEHVNHSAKHTEDIEDLKIEGSASVVKRGKKAGRSRSRQPWKLTTCGICNATFRSEVKYTQHHKTEHKDVPLPRDEKRHICEFCGVKFSYAGLQVHLNTHTRQKLHTCVTCQMQFNTKTSLNRHQLTHTGEKPFACPLCDKRFTQTNSMKLHYRTVHLKEPYPKRNRKKKTDVQQELEDLIRDSRL